MNNKPAFFQLAVCLIATILPNILLAQSAPVVVPLWPNGAPGFENRRTEPELAKDYWVKTIHNPSLTVYLPPKEKATGAAVIICPSGRLEPPERKSI